MGQVILVTSGKGGAGKSTVCARLGEALVRCKKNVLLIEGSHRSLDVLFGVAESVLYDLADAVEQRCELTDAMLDVSADGLLRLICAPLDDRFFLDEGLCGELMDTLKVHFDYILIEVDGTKSEQLGAYAAAANRAVIVCAPDRVSVRASRAVSDALAGAGLSDIRLCVNMLPRDFGRNRQVPDLDWMIDQICAQLIAVIAFDRSLDLLGQPVQLSNPTKIIFDYFAQRIMGNYIDLLVQ